MGGINLRKERRQRRVKVPHGDGVLGGVGEHHDDDHYDEHHNDNNYDLFHHTAGALLVVRPLQVLPGWKRCGVMDESLPLPDPDSTAIFATRLSTNTPPAIIRLSFL